MEDLSLSGREVVNPQHRYGDMPLIVLSADQHPFPPDMPVEVREQAMLYFQALKSGHQSLCFVIQARTDQAVPDSGHLIQFDDPAAVRAAVDTVVADARSQPAAN